MKDKKGIQLNQAFGAVLTLVLVAVLVIVAIIIFVSLNASFAGSAVGSQTDETLASMDEAGKPLAAASTNCSFSSPVVIAMVNASSDLIDPGNYSVSSVGLVKFISTDVGDVTSFNDSDWEANYTWKWGSEACTAGEKTITEFSNYTSLIGLVGTIIFLGLVIGILVAAFAFGGKV